MLETEAERLARVKAELKKLDEAIAKFRKEIQTALDIRLKPPK